MIAKALLSVAALLCVSLSFAQSIAIPIDPNNPRTVLQADLLLPAGTGKAPALLIAPGETYHRNLPIIAGLAESAVASGWVTLRFDWRYYTNNPDSKPSKDYITEQAEFEAALAYLKKHPRVDASRIVLAGKSQGSMVATQVFLGDANAKAVLLLTPICRSGGDAGKNYKGLIADKRPVIVVMGNNDGICPVAHAYYWAKDGDPRIAVLTFPGDNSLLVGDVRNSAMTARNQRNIDIAVGSAVQWLNEITGQ